MATATISGQTTRNKGASNSQNVERVFIRGNRRISETDIKSWISTHKRGVYSPEKLNGDVRTLFDTGHFADVKVYVEEGLHGRKIVTFEVIDRPLIFDIEYEGIDFSQQAEIIEEWHKQKVELSKGSEYDPVRIRRAAQIMQDLLINKQKRVVKVIPYIEQQTATEVLVTFKVEIVSQR
jgi:outer membrane protein insertion porin family